MDNHCPVCLKPLELVERYPRRVCDTCASNARSKDGRLLVFSNESMSGGVIAHYAETGETYPSHECYIYGIKCHADEARFGGIVIEAA